MKDVKGFEGLYKVDIDGNIFNAKGKQVKVSKGKVNLFDENKKKKTGIVARIVLEAYVGESTGKVVYKDGDRENTCLANLEWFDPESALNGKTVDAGSRVSERHANVMKWIHHVLTNGIQGWDFSMEVSYRYYILSCMGRNWKHYSLNTYRAVIESDPNYADYTFEVCHAMGQVWLFDAQGDDIKYPKLIDGSTVDLSGIYPEFYVHNLRHELPFLNEYLKQSNLEYIFRGGNKYKPDTVYANGTEVV